VERVDGLQWVCESSLNQQITISVALSQQPRFYVGGADSKKEFFLIERDGFCIGLLAKTTLCSFLASGIPTRPKAKALGTQPRLRRHHDSPNFSEEDLQHVPRSAVSRLSEGCKGPMVETGSEICFSCRYTTASCFRCLCNWWRSCRLRGERSSGSGRR
jgi:hypothetical protein